MPDDRRLTTHPVLRDAFASPAAKRAYVRSLFATIADRYDFITVFLSYGQDRRWKRRLIRLAEIRTGARVLDLATGTGDIAFAAAAHGARVVGLDITRRMIELAIVKGREGQEGREGKNAAHPASRPALPAFPAPPAFLVGDMQALPFPPASFDIVTTGYGLRNVPDLTLAVDEIRRVLAPGGQLLSLDFNRPSQPIVRAAYLAYLTMVGSSLGWMLHGDPDTYRYIPASIRRYPGAQGVAALLERRGFARATAHSVLGGLMTIHHAVRD